jgi:hypothetical protein
VGESGSALVRRDREREEPASPSALVMDSQSVKTTEGGPGNDGAKKVTGRKRQS